MCMWCLSEKMGPCPDHQGGRKGLVLIRPTEQEEERET